MSVMGTRYSSLPPKTARGGKVGLMPHPQVPELQEITQSRLREGSARGGTETEGRTRPSFEIKNVAKGTQQRYKNQKTLSREAGDSRRGGQRPGRCRYLRLSEIMFLSSVFILISLKPSIYIYISITISTYPLIHLSIH